MDGKVKLRVICPQRAEKLLEELVHTLRADYEIVCGNYLLVR